jgi:hypothetical protein
MLQNPISSAPEGFHAARRPSRKIVPARALTSAQQEALNRGLKLNDLFALCFNELRKSIGVPTLIE